MKIWDYTLRDRYEAAHLTTDPGPAPESKPGSPFTNPNVPRLLFRDGLELSVAIADRSLNDSLRALRRDNPEVPSSGDRSSGVLLFDGDRIVGSMTTKGSDVGRIKYLLFVDEGYQGRGYAVDMWVAWLMACCEYNILGNHVETVPARKIMLKVHRKVVELALAAGHEVPERVLRSVKAGSDDEHEALRLPNGKIAA